MRDHTNLVSVLKILSQNWPFHENSALIKYVAIRLLAHKTTVGTSRGTSRYSNSHLLIEALM